MSRQHGCIATWQLLLLGVAPSSVSALSRREGWESAHKGVHVLGGPPRPERQAMAALLTMTPRNSLQLAESLAGSGLDTVDAAARIGVSRGVLTGLTGAQLLGLVDEAPLRPHVLVPSSSHMARTGLEVTRADPAAAPSQTVWGLPVAEPWRILWDLAWSLRHGSGAAGLLHAMATRADRMRILPVDDLVALVEEPVLWALPRRTPRLLTGLVEQLRPGFSHSATEALAREIAMEVAVGMGLLVEPRPYPIRSEGRIIAEADIAVVSIRLDTEVDGPHHRLPRQKVRDAHRDGLLDAVRWDVVRYDVEYIHESLARYRQSYEADLHARLDRAA